MKLEGKEMIISLHMCIKISSNIYKGNIKINLCKRHKWREKWGSNVNLDI